MQKAEGAVESQGTGNGSRMNIEAARKGSNLSPLRSAEQDSVLNPVGKENSTSAGQQNCPTWLGAPRPLQLWVPWAHMSLLDLSRALPPVQIYTQEVQLAGWRCTAKASNFH